MKNLSHSECTISNNNTSDFYHIFIKYMYRLHRLFQNMETESIS